MVKNMIYKIEVDWKMRSPLLQVLTGEVRIDQIDMGRIDHKKIAPILIKKEQGMLGYTDCPTIFNRCKPLVDVMVRAYFDGMMMQDTSYVWFDGCHRHNNTVTITMKD